MGHGTPPFQDVSPASEVFHRPAWCSVLPGDRPHLPVPIATRAIAEPHREKKTTAQPASPRRHRVPADDQAPLLTNAWYSTSDLAARLRVNASTLRRWRTARPPQGPPFVALSERVVMYSALDVEEWLRSRRTAPAKGIHGR
ncbi:helix-turn-helix transcriptional regulator [Streptomyces eurythermus]|uniref:helix-turn-helix transcriptional regulator n=1 Tax=Streptomyces eurythermus TaxID=42237 RepID=UPI0033E6073A